MRRGRYHPRQEWILLLICAVFALGCVRSVPAPEVPKENAEKTPAIPPHVLIDVRLCDKEVRLQLRRSGTRDITYTGFKEIDPLRLVVDLYNTVPQTLSSLMAVEDEVIDKIRAVEFMHESQPVTRVEIGLKRDTAYVIDDRGCCSSW